MDFNPMFSQFFLMSYRSDIVWLHLKLLWTNSYNLIERFSLLVDWKTNRFCYEMWRVYFCGLYFSTIQSITWHINVESFLSSQFGILNYFRSVRFRFCFADYLRMSAYYKDIRKHLLGVDQNYFYIHRALQRFFARLF